ncbi:MAG: hypothetical protein QM709_12905 [Spongiibacteraceae bacterium]
MIADYKKRLPSNLYISQMKQPKWRITVGRSISIFTCASFLALAGCSGGSGDGDDGGGSVSPTINTTAQGYAVKGPLKNATASLYSFDLNAPDLKGSLLKTGSTDDAGRFINLAVPAAVSGPFLLEVTNGKELDGSDPVIPALRTVVRTDQLVGNAQTPIVVTPLTTLVTEMAHASAVRKNTATPGTITRDNFFTTTNGGEMGEQASVVKAALGLGLLDSINIFTDAPLIQGSNDAAAALRHRTAIEVNAALFKQILTEVGTGDANAVFTAYAQDLSDGQIDGAAAGVPLSALSGHNTQIVSILSQSPSALMALTVPGVTPTQTIAQLNSVLAQQAGVQTAPAALTITKSTVVGVDSDGDGKIDAQDRFPNNASEFADTDNDCATAYGYTGAGYLTATAGNGCGDNSDYAPQNAAIQNACQAATGSSDPNKPVANAGSAISRLFTKTNYDTVGGRTVTLAGGNSCDPNGDNLTYQWTVVSVPMSGSLELLGKDSQGNAITKQNMLSNYSIANPAFEANFAGNYVFSLVVSDGVNTSDPSTVTVTIDKGYYVDIDGAFMFLSSFGALLLLAVPAKLRKRNSKS